MLGTRIPLPFLLVPLSLAFSFVETAPAQSRVCRTDGVSFGQQGDSVIFQMSAVQDFFSDQTYAVVNNVASPANDARLAPGTAGSGPSDQLPSVLGSAVRAGLPASLSVEFSKYHCRNVSGDPQLQFCNSPVRQNGQLTNPLPPFGFRVDTFQINRLRQKTPFHDPSVDVEYLEVIVSLISTEGFRIQQSKRFECN